MLATEGHTYIVHNYIGHNYVHPHIHPQVAEVLAAEVLIGVVRGRTELGPRALGHRSLLMVPASKDIRLVLNKLKRRAWYRPVAPVTIPSHAQDLLQQQQPSRWAFDSPFMSFAPRIDCHSYIG